MSRPRSSSGKKPKSSYDDSSSFDLSKAETLFNKYCDSDDPEIISMDGISTISEELGIDPTSDVRVLVLFWRLGALSKPGSISKTEFLNGLRQLRKDSIEGLMTILPSLDPGFLDRSEFREFYRFVFQFSREGTHKTIEKDVVSSLLSIVLNEDRAPHLPLFLEFLKQCTHQRVTLDQWDSFLQFQYVIKVDMTGYDSESAWPLLLDEYVDWRRAKSS